MSTNILPTKIFSINAEFGYFTQGMLTPKSTLLDGFLGIFCVK